MLSARFVLAIAVTGAALSAGCGPEITPPGAAGQISLAPGMNATGFTHVEVRLIDDQDGGSLDLAELFKEGDDAEARMPLEELPTDYAIEHDAESSPIERWRVTAWLSRTESADAPADGDVIGSELLDLTDCTAPLGEATYCGTTDSIDILIEATVVIR